VRKLVRKKRINPWNFDKVVSRHTCPKENLLALRVVIVGNLAGRTALAAGWAVPAETAALSPDGGALDAC
jgi:hypothetical protein